MTYKEIAEKYKDAVKQRDSSITAAKSAIEFYKQFRQNCIDARELYRSDGTVNRERTKNWENMTRHIKRLDEKIAIAEIELGKVCLGENGMSELLKKLRL